MQRNLSSFVTNAHWWKEKQVTFLNLLKKTPTCFVFSLHDRHYNGIAVQWKVMGENGSQLYSICENFEGISNLVKGPRVLISWKKKYLVWMENFLSQKFVYMYELRQLRPQLFESLDQFFRNLLAQGLLF
jgi:hypothetical protein